MTVTFCVGLWAVAGREAGLRTYEDQVLALLPEHGGRVVIRVVAAEVSSTAGPAEEPAETQVIEFDDQVGFEGYMSDPRRTALADERDSVIARTVLQRVVALSS